MIALIANQNINATISISGSKSISNRILIIKHVLGLDIDLNNISDAEDTALLQEALAQIENITSATINIHHAGTDMRFLTALLSCKKGEWVLTGSERMKQRPIGELVNALKNLGADITYLEKQNYPPLKIIGKELLGGTIEIDGSISSQFISALLLIAHTFKNGLELSINNKIVSWPYIQMTISLLQQFGIAVEINAIERNTKLVIKHNPPSIFHLPSSISVESDWSSASYWFSICALSANASIKLNYFNEKSLQADSVLPQLYNSLGVNTEFKKDYIFLTKKQINITEFNYDFTNCPDIAQTIAVTCLALGINANLTGLQTLKVKETDRIIALKNELEKFGAEVQITNNSITIITIKKNSKILSSSFNSAQDDKTPVTLSGIKGQSTIDIETYNDHRMAMAFAPLCLKYPSIQIKNPEVVTKSYPQFWEDLKKVDFKINSK